MMGWQAALQQVPLCGARDGARYLSEVAPLLIGQSDTQGDL